MRDNRKETIRKLTEFLKKNYPNIQAFDSRNTVGDCMENVYSDNGISVDYCSHWKYVEVFGLTKKEFCSLLKKNEYGFDEIKDK